MKSKPESNEYPVWYDKYVQSVPVGDIVDVMNRQLKTAAAILNSIDEEKSLYRYADNKWSIKELLGHINDVERIFAYRALRFIRMDKTNLSPMEQDDYVKAAKFDNISFDSLKKEFRFIRKSTIMLFNNLDNESWMRTGFSDGNEISVRAMAYIIVGHAQHHLNILRERYLN
jgi:hypothetical protein